MLVPLALLAVGAVFAGGVFAEQFIGPDKAEFWRGAITSAPTPTGATAALPAWEVWAPLVVTALGLFGAWYVYVRHEGMGARIAARRGPTWAFLYNKWYFDEIYETTFVRATAWLGDFFWKVGDQRVIDGLGPDGVSAAAYAVGKATGKVQTGYVYHYAFVMLLGVAGLLSFALWAFH